MIFVFIQSLGGLLPDIKSETADVVQEINTYFTGLHGILQAREKQLTREVYDAFKAGVEPLYNLVNIVFITNPSLIRPNFRCTVIVKYYDIVPLKR
jgi:hypothetical protein